MADIDEINIHRRHKIKHIVGEVIHEFERRILRPRLRNPRNVHLGQRRRNRGGQDQTDSRDVLQYSSEQSDQTLCQILCAHPCNADRRHMCIEQRRTIGIVMNALNGRIAVREHSFSFNRRKNLRKPCGAVCRERDDVPCGTQRHDLARHGIGRTQREINEEVYAIRTNRSSRLLRAHRSELPQ